MRTIKWDGTLTALSSIAHGDKDTGIKHGFRRETIITASGERLAGVPVLSGAVLRGDMRRLAAAMAQNAIVGDGRLPFEAVHTLTVGGSLRPTAQAAEVLTGEKQAMIRDLVPMLGIFGFTGRSRIASGRLYVDKGVPVAQETAHLTPAGAELFDELPSIWELIQAETYTRFADVQDARAQPFIEQGGDTEIPRGSGMMLWAQETIPAGAKLFHSVVLDQGTPAEVSFMDELMRRWAQRGRVGAHKARGLGRVRADYVRECMDVLGDPAPAEEPAVDWREQTRERLDEVKEALSWLI